MRPRLPVVHWSRLFVLATVLHLASALAVNARAAERAVSPIDAIATHIQALLDKTGSIDKDIAGLDAAALRRFYQGRDYFPAWTGTQDSLARAAILRATMARADTEGLNAGDYATAMETPGQTAPAADANEDLRLTDAILRYAHDVRLGRVPPEAMMGDEIDLPTRAFDAVAALQSAIRENSLDHFLKTLPPPFPEYARLTDALARYRVLATMGEWRSVPGNLEIKLDQDDPRLSALRARLAREDPDYAKAGEEATKTALLAAVRRFQLKNGLDPDGRVGAKTLAMLNISPASRVWQIIANMERWRWIPRALEARRAAVNAADGTLEVVEDGKIVLASNVIVGDAKHPSPILRAVATSVTVNPPWNVPPSIARKEMLPKLKRDQSYLLNQNIVLLNGPTADPHGLDIDWRAISTGRFPYRLQQLPGPLNSLGGVKLEMPNRFDVYLHDTPAKRLFARTQRNFSHGCVRVEQSLALASVALTGDAKLAVPELKAMIADGVTRHLPLKHPLPVYILYWTAIADANGDVAFRPDVYGRDTRLIAALTKTFRQPPEAKSVATIPSTECRG